MQDNVVKNGFAALNQVIEGQWFGGYTQTSQVLFAKGGGLGEAKSLQTDYIVPQLSVRIHGEVIGHQRTIACQQGAYAFS